MVAVMGPTAAGKTPLAERIAEELGAELINADAFQVYRGLDIGTAKPPDKERYALIDIVNPDEQFGVGQWVALATERLQEAWRNRQSCVVVGGTGLYIRALFEGYDTMGPAPDPQLRAELNRIHADLGLPALVDMLENEDADAWRRVDRSNPARVKRAIERARLGTKLAPAQVPAFDKVKLGLEVPQDTLQRRIDDRVHQMVQNGWALEIERLREKGYRPEDPGFRAIGYRTLWRHLEGEIGLDEAIATTITDTSRYAKRQRTWLRSEPGLIPLSAAPGNDPVAQALESFRLVSSEE
jgi:tRNA dimethylallyltransferase